QSSNAAADGTKTAALAPTCGGERRLPPRHARKPLSHGGFDERLHRAFFLGAADNDSAEKFPRHANSKRGRRGIVLRHRFTAPSGWPTDPEHALTGDRDDEQRGTAQEREHDR